jgi:mevalonate kinase
MANENGGTGTWYANGKLLISGEYLVLRGAKALAIPLRFGQSLTVSHSKGEPVLHWTAKIPGSTWFTAQFYSESFEILTASDEIAASRLRSILQTIREIKPEFLTDTAGINAATELNFPPEWGIGSSSSLIANVSRWAGVDPFELNRRIFGGSGYDIAAALSNNPIIYHLEKGIPGFESIEFYPPSPDHIWLVYQNKKENSQAAVSRFSETEVSPTAVETISEITRRLSETKNFTEFSELLTRHESLMARILHTKPVRERLFPDFEGSIKSLGAWGGDFLLAASPREGSYVRDYFWQKGFSTLFRYDEMVFKKLF